MTDTAPLAAAPLLARLGPALNRILEVQSADGSIPWFENGPWDPWNHVESAMALTAMGAIEAARSAFEFLLDTQREEGAWMGEYGNTLPVVDRDYISRQPAPAFLDTNFCAYPAVGVVHYLLATQDLERTRRWWPMIQRALDFVLSLQHPDGTISWALEARNTPEDDALLCGNASIVKSLECGIFLAEACGQPRPDWQARREALMRAICVTPERFDRRKTGVRYAMDWYYPVLAGVFTSEQGIARLNQKWQKFVVSGRGCRCVSDEPWVTVAETCELAMALLQVGRQEPARALFNEIQSLRDASGVFWMGWQFEEHLIWPKERPSWTQAAVILAADALDNRSAASRLLVERLPTVSATI